MKNIALLLVTVLVSSASFAQNVSLKKDTIYLDKTPVALFQRSNSKPVRYFLATLKGARLMELHDARIDVNSKPGIVVAFLSDHRQAMITQGDDFPLSFLKEITRIGFIISGPQIKPTLESEFIKVHPLPAGYIDVEQFMDKPLDRARELQQPE